MEETVRTCYSENQRDIIEVEHIFYIPCMGIGHMGDDSTKDIKISFNMRYKRIPTGDLLGQCLQFPGIILSAKDFETLEKEMVDSIETYLSLHPEKLYLVSIGGSQYTAPQLPELKKAWKEEHMTNVITVRSR
jgi:hypothetical protein